MVGAAGRDRTFNSRANCPGALFQDRLAVLEGRVCLLPPQPHYEYRLAQYLYTVNRINTHISGLVKDGYMVARAFTKEKLGFTSVQAIMDSLVEFLVDETRFFRLVAQEPGKYIIAATRLIDPTIPRVPRDIDMIWGLGLSQGGWDPATDNQLCLGWGNFSYNNDPATSEITIDDPIHYNRQAIMTADRAPPLFDDNGNRLPVPFSKLTSPPSASNPHGYRCTVTRRGISLCIYSQVDNNGWKAAGIFNLQRLINYDGSAYLENRAPIFVMWNNLDSAPGQYATIDYNGIDRGMFNSGTGDLRWYVSVLKESDVHTATESAVAIPYGLLPFRGRRPSENRSWNIRQVQFEGRATLRRFPTTWEQPALLDNNELAFLFPQGFTTDRFSYQKEMDQICACSADAVTFGQIVPIQAFGEARKYQMMPPSRNSIVGSAVSIGILVDGPEFR